jgi:hypothetical protein
MMKKVSNFARQQDALKKQLSDFVPDFEIKIQMDAAGRTVVIANKPCTPLQVIHLLTQTVMVNVTNMIQQESMIINTDKKLVMTDEEETGTDEVLDHNRDTDNAST